MRYWFSVGSAVLISAMLDKISHAAPPWADERLEDERMVDHVLITATRYPAFLGGPFTFPRKGIS